jgi:hypothetical protein
LLEAGKRAVEIPTTAKRIIVADMKMYKIKLFIKMLFDTYLRVYVYNVSGYKLDDRAIEVRSLAEARDFSSNLCAQTGSGAHPASCTMGTGRSFSGGKAQPGREADHSPLLLQRL